MTAPRLLDCRTREGRMSSLSWQPRDEGRRGTVTAHEGSKPNVGDFLALSVPDDPDAMACYLVEWVDHCHGVDPAHMWIARVRFIRGSEIAGRKYRVPDMEPTQ